MCNNKEVQGQVNMSIYRIVGIGSSSDLIVCMFCVFLGDREKQVRVGIGWGYWQDCMSWVGWLIGWNGIGWLCSWVSCVLLQWGFGIYYA